MNFLRMIKIRQDFPSLGIVELEKEIKKALITSNLNQVIRVGMRVGITVGSRGIKNIAPILKETVAYVRYLGGSPVMIASMGSHGGGTPAGQIKLLHSLGIAEENIGAPVVCSIDCVEIGQGAHGKIYLNLEALKCDAIIVVNRIKPHTSFHGDHESGLLKMLAVGLGGPPGAASLHRCRPRLLSQAVAETGLAVLKAAPVVLGLAILEDAHEQTCKIVPICPEKIYEEEKILLREARDYLPGLPVSDLDVLIVDWIGKNFSGTGMDTNVIGRLRIHDLPEPESPRINRIVVLDIAPEAHGNAYGIGLADFTTERLVSKLDRDSVYLNALTSTFVQRAMLPMTLPNDREAIKAAFLSLGTTFQEDAKVIRIHDTLHLSEMLVSENVFHELSNLPFIQDLGQWGELEFNSRGDLLPF